MEQVDVKLMLTVLLVSWQSFDWIQRYTDCYLWARDYETEDINPIINLINQQKWLRKIWGVCSGTRSLQVLKT